MTPRQWYRVEAKADDPTVAEIHIIDVIGSWDDDWFARNFGLDMGVTARQFVEDLSKLPATVNTIKVRINSPGGDIQAGINIANALREQQLSKGRTVETYVDGIAASIASVIAMAGSKVHIGDNALMMVHNPYAIEIGTAEDMRKMADILDTMRGQIVNTYKWHTTLKDEAIVALMDAETWMDASEAIANGFATDAVEGLKAAASIDRRALATLKVPDKFKARVDALLTPPPVAPTPAPADVIARECANAGLDLQFANTLIAANVPADQVMARIGVEKTARATAAETERTSRVAAEARATEITALCTAAKQPTLAADFIAGQMPVEKVRHALATIAAAIDNKDIDGSLTPSGVAAKDSWKQAFARATHSIFAR